MAGTPRPIGAGGLTRGALRALIAERGVPQAVLRIGYAEAISVALRRPVASVTECPASAPA